MLGTLKRVRAANGKWHVEVCWGRVGLYIVAAIMLFWFVLTAFIFCSYKYFKGYDEITVFEAVSAPFDMKSYRQKVGEYNIKHARTLMEEQKWREAFMNLSAGVNRAPKNIMGRKLLAEFYVAMFRRPDIAMQTLEVGLFDAKNSLEYMRLYIRLLIDQCEDKRLVAVAEKLMKDPEVTDPGVRMYLTMALSAVYAMHGNYALSTKYAHTNGIDKTLPGIVRLSKNMWEAGDRQEAIDFLLNNLGVSQKRGVIYGVLVKYYSMMGDFSSARRYALLRVSEDPLSFGPKFEYITLLQKAGDDSRMKAEIETIFNQNRHDNSAMLHLANYAADNGDMALMRRIYDVALDGNFPIAPYALLMLETMIVNGSHKDAVAFSEEVLKEKPVWARKYNDTLESLRAIAYFGAGDPNMANMLISEVLKRNTCSPQVLVATARRIDNLGGLRLAHKILEHATVQYPHNQLALTRLVQMEIKMGNSTNLDKHLFRLLQMRRPPRKLVLEAMENLGSDKFIFAADRASMLREVNKLVSSKSGQTRFGDDAEISTGKVSDVKTDTSDEFGF